MSMMICVHCSRHVDTDFDPESFVIRGTYAAAAQSVNPQWRQPETDVCVCERCREYTVDGNGYYWPEGVPDEPL